MSYEDAQSERFNTDGPQEVRKRESEIIERRKPNVLRVVYTLDILVVVVVICALMAVMALVRLTNLQVGERYFKTIPLDISPR